MLKSVPLSAEHRRVGAARFQVTKGSIRKQSIEKHRFLREDVAIADVKMDLRGYTRLPPGIRAEGARDPVSSSIGGKPHQLLA